jgi:hypothetical protein
MTQDTHTDIVFRVSTLSDFKGTVFAIPSQFRGMMVA